MRTAQVTRAGMFIALTTVSTLIIQIPNPATQGYLNLGDAMVMTSALVFGARVGMLAGGIGAALADVIGGFFLWAPWTLVIKGSEGAIVGYLAARGSRPDARAAECFRDGWCVLLGGALMVLGYYSVESWLLGRIAALTEVPGNLLQVGIGGLVAIPSASVLRRTIRT